MQPLYARSHDTTAENDDTVRGAQVLSQSHPAHATERHAEVHPVHGGRTSLRCNSCGRLRQSMRNTTQGRAYPWRLAPTTERQGRQRLGVCCPHRQPSTVLARHHAKDRPQPDHITQGLHLRLRNLRTAHGNALLGTTPAHVLAGVYRYYSWRSCTGYGKDAFVNRMLAAFWGTAARRGCRPRFTRVESKANVADAISRGDLTRAQQENWTRLDDHTDAIIGILVKAAGDADYAAGQAVDDLSQAIN